jgi:hypothetical protein
MAVPCLLLGLRNAGCRFGKKMEESRNRDAQMESLSDKNVQTSRAKSIARMEKFRILVRSIIPWQLFCPFYVRILNSTC